MGFIARVSPGRKLKRYNVTLTTNNESGMRILSTSLIITCFIGYIIEHAALNKTLRQHVV